eukprot:CAMPEP_0119548854 /NCGR_PEP_ID=MMETSP1352-20130426/2693_1 /TAXON_ID=265584 /ORGANISM="Stauroneis constricta, Strain CCMP1120" /LENGTH=48 /DNA_ID= /DNA_START= /DNA_END= /DNA_ORIENTATION=
MATSSASSILTHHVFVFLPSWGDPNNDILPASFQTVWTSGIGKHLKKL